MRGMRLPQRRLEIDLLRALAITMMVAYHAAYDLHAFHGWDIDPFSGGWLWLQRATAVLFLSLVGVSAVLLREGMRGRGASRRKIAGRFWRRGLWVLLCGMLVSTATLVADADSFVRFGILHLIGASLIAMPLFLELGAWNLLLATGVLGLQHLTGAEPGASGLLLPLGVHAPGFTSVDYFPVVPWFSAVLLGAGIGHLAYVRPGLPTGLQNALDGLWESRVPLWLSVPGRHSLLIYMLHQPLVLAVLWLVLGQPRIG